ncbi:hypothetical protein OIU78_028272 [Salix suchowensis]|nr:hypothetical protein OIU78_028272 [Salix suchowensis]
MERVKVPIRFSRGSNDHPDEGWDPKAVPVVKGISIRNVLSFNSTKAPVLEGIEDAPFGGICMKNVSLRGVLSSLSWHCEFVSGFTDESAQIVFRDQFALRNNIMEVVGLITRGTTSPV